MKNNNIFEYETLICGTFINKYGNIEHGPNMVTTDYIEISKDYFENVIKKEINPKGHTFGLYNKKKEIIQELVIVNNSPKIKPLTSFNEFPKWNNDAEFIRISAYTNI